jgi:hypothetical protein
MKKAIVFDLDNTLVETLDVPLDRAHPFVSGVIKCIDGVVRYVYVRPNAFITLRVCRGAPDTALVLFSAGGVEYISAILESVIFPWLGPAFYFDAIYTCFDLDEDGVKRMDKVKEALKVNEILLVDDVEKHCMDGAEKYGLHWFNIAPFYAKDPSSDKDSELLVMLQHGFFYSS